MWYLLYFVCSLPVVDSYTFDDVKQLREQLFHGHDAAIRPVLNQSNPIQISLALTLFTIVDFDMTNGRLETMGYYTATWQDENLIWNNTRFKDIPSIPVESDKIWSPNIAQLDAIGEFENELIAILLQNNGYAFKAVARPYITFCDLDMTHYPVDEHVCSFEFISVDHPSREMTLVPSTYDVDTSGLRTHGEWKLTNFYVKQILRKNQGVEASAMDFFFVFKRQPGFTILHKSLPLIILGIGDMFVHIVPLNSGERISFSVTVLLAFVFWQAVVIEELPQNSAHISIFSVLITASMLISGVTTVSSVILCRISCCDGEHTIPDTLQKLALKCRSNKDKNKAHNYLKKTGPESNRTTNIPNGKAILSANVMGVSVNGDRYLENHEHAKKLRNTNTAENNDNIASIGDNSDVIADDRNKKPVTWVEVANMIDCFLFVCHVIVLVGKLIVLGIIFSP